jgi:hypothetical protein
MTLSVYMTACILLWAMQADFISSGETEGACDAHF